MSNPHTASRRQMVKPLFIMAVVLAVVLGGVLAWHALIGKFTREGMAKGASAPQTVSTIDAATSEWQDYIQSTGTLRAVRGADLSAQVAGVVEEIAFESGNEVSAGKVLLRLKPNDDPAKLQQLQATAELAEQTLKRDQEQLAAQAIAQANIDTDMSSAKSARAQVSAQQALMDEKVVKAPFAGRLGIRQVDIGQYLTAGTAIVTLQALDPMLIDFYVPQQALSQIKIGQTITASVDTYPGKSFTGSVESINSKIDSGSRNVQVRAAFHNREKQLVPGMFASVRIAAGDKSDKITLPQTAITYNPYGDTVFIVGKGGNDAQGKPRLTVQQRFVKVGSTRGDQIAVESGLKVGEAVVTAGQIKLRNGTAVSINNDVPPNNDAHPNPPNE